MQLAGPVALLPLMAAAAAVPALVTPWRMRARAAVLPAAQLDYVPQFVTSPGAMELYADRQPEIEPTRAPDDGGDGD
jgi:hypothetical protein